MEPGITALDMYAVLIVTPWVRLLVNEPSAGGSLLQTSFLSGTDPGTVFVTGCRADDRLCRDAVFLLLLIIKIEGQIVCSQIDFDGHWFLDPFVIFSFVVKQVGDQNAVWFEAVFVFGAAAAVAL